MSTIKVSVLMPVYNHEKYLAHAIESVLMQRTNFRYELIIGEDWSTDESRSIVLKYWNDAPDIIIPVLHPQNIGAEKNTLYMYKMAKGKYVAFLEGDDYWTDSDKLQTQIDFLDEHPEYSACYHSVHVVDENDAPRCIDFPDITNHHDYDFCKATWTETAMPGQTSSRVEKNFFRFVDKALMDDYQKCKTNGDMKAIVTALTIGKIRRLGKTMSCYRLSYNGDSWNARMKRNDGRDEMYVNLFESDRFAARWLDIDSLLPAAPFAILHSVYMTT